MKNSEMPATPVIDDKISTHCTEIFYGLTKREHFAGLAMQALIPMMKDADGNIDAGKIKAVSYFIADEMASEGES